MKFIAGVMLGKLAKRMRLLGFDVLYDRMFDDDTIMRLAREQQRVVLTRDTAFAKQLSAVTYLFITDDLVKDQLNQVFSAFPAYIVPGLLTRCSRCNGPLAPIAKIEVKDRVPQFVYEKNGLFMHCGTCGKIYWHGTHVKRMKQDWMRSP